jgi:hypothetical protein
VRVPVEFVGEVGRGEGGERLGYLGMGDVLVVDV